MQPPSEQLTIARRPLDIEDFIDIIRRHRTWILAPFFLGLVVSVVVAFLWPDTFISSAIIRVVPAQVPERFVPSNVNAELGQLINSMTQQILSRGTLTNLIQTYNLYPNDRKSRPMEDIIEDMRRDVRVSAVRSLTRQVGRELSTISAFEVGFSYSERILAQRVTADLVTRYIDENIRARASQSVLTTQFLRDQWESAKREYETSEQKLSDFRARNAGRLPEHVSMNLQKLNALENRLVSVGASVSRAGNDKLLLESQFQTLKAQLTYIAAPSEEVTFAAGRSERLVRLEQQIVNSEMIVNALRDRYTETHPDVQRAKSDLALLEASRKSLISEEQAKPEAKSRTIRRVSPTAAKEAQEIEAALQRTQSLIQIKEIEIQDLGKERIAVEREITGARQALQASPVSDTEYATLMQERNSARQKYDELTVKKGQSELATDLENRRQGEMLELLDPASLPQTPAAPKRWMIIVVGTCIGLALGLTVAGAREVRDTSLKNLKDVRAYTQLTVLASVPLLENDFVVRRRRRMAWLLWSTACFVGILIMSGTVAYYYVRRG
jgi:polysaccharide chain length determinant protein (PEP-CTERM system associated)